MSFSSKNITQTTKRGISFLKGATFFFLGMSLVLFVTKAFEVVPTTQNFVSYFQKMFLTPDGFNLLPETISLDGVAGDASFAGTVTGDTVAATTVCLTTDSGTPCRTTWPVGGGSASAAGNTTNIQFNGGSANFSGSDDLVRDSTNGRLGIGTSSPSKELDVYGTGSFSEDVFIDNGNLLFGEGQKYIHLPIRTAPPTTNRVGYDLSIKAGDSSDNSAAPTSGGNLYLQGGNISSVGGGFYPAGNEQGGNIYIQGGGGAAPYGNILLAYSGGKVGIGTDTPSAKLDISLSGGNNVFVREGPSDDVPQIYSTSGLYIGADQGVKIGSSNVTIGESVGITVKGPYSGPGNTNRVGIGTGDPQELLHVAQNGKAQFGDYLKLYSNTYNGVIQTDNSTSSIVLNTSGTNTRMTINASGYVGINQSAPTANLEVVGTMKILSSLTGKTYTGINTGYFFPSGVLSGGGNTGMNTDTIRYIECNPFGTGAFIIEQKDISNETQALLFGYYTVTLHLPAGETFMVNNMCTEGLIVFVQTYGKNPANLGGSLLDFNDFSDYAAVGNIIRDR